MLSLKQVHEAVGGTLVLAAKEKQSLRLQALMKAIDQVEKDTSIDKTLKHDTLFIMFKYHQPYERHFNESSLAKEAKRKLDKTAKKAELEKLTKFFVKDSLKKGAKVPMMREMA